MASFEPFLMKKSSCELKEALKMPQKNKITGKFRSNKKKKRKKEAKKKIIRKRKANWIAPKEELILDTLPQVYDSLILQNKRKVLRFHTLEKIIRKGNLIESHQKKN